MAQRYRANRRHKTYLSEWLAATGVSQAELARRMNPPTDPVNVHRWITQPYRLNLDAISAIEAALLLQPGDLFRPPADVARDHALRDAVATIREQIPGD